MLIDGLKYICNIYFVLLERLFLTICQSNVALPLLILRAYAGVILVTRYFLASLVRNVDPANLKLWAFISSAVLTRLHLANFFMSCSFIVMLIESHWQVLARIYRKHPTLLAQHFPSGQDPKRRMHRVVNAIVEGAQNPLVMGTATAVGGFVVWKALDVYEVHKSADIADKDRTIAAETAIAIADKERATALDVADKESATAIAIADKDREAEDRRHRESLDTANRHHRETLEAEDRRHRETLDTANRDAAIGSTHEFD